VDLEGLYRINYWMTRSGSYSIYASSSSGFALLGSPAAISVTSSSAVVTNSYVYGQVAQGTAGRTSYLYVQVRDEFENKLTDMSSFEDMQVNLYLKLGGTQGEACSRLDGFRVHDLSVVTQYGTGPASGTGADVAESRVHTLTLNWFRDGHFLFVVRHNSTLLNC